MELTHRQTVKTIAVLLLLLAISQPIYTALFVGAPEFDRLFLWRLEGIIFVLLAAFSVSALVLANNHALGFSAIALGAVLKLFAVGLGLTQFWPFNAAAELNSDLGDVATSVVALSFFCYNSGNILVGLAAVDFGKIKMREGSRAIGGATLLVGAIAFVANTLVMMFGFEGIFPSPIAGASGVLATLLLAICLFSISRADREGSRPNQG